jgi:hypothetical protein
MAEITTREKLLFEIQQNFLRRYESPIQLREILYGLERLGGSTGGLAPSASDTDLLFTQSFQLRTIGNPVSTSEFNLIATGAIPGSYNIVHLNSSEALSFNIVGDEEAEAVQIGGDEHEPGEQFIMFVSANPFGDFEYFLKRVEAIVDYSALASKALIIRKLAADMGNLTLTSADNTAEHIYCPNTDPRNVICNNADLNTGFNSAIYAQGATLTYTGTCTYYNTAGQALTGITQTSGLVVVIKDAANRITLIGDYTATLAE